MSDIVGVDLNSYADDWLINLSGEERNNLEAQLQDIEEDDRARIFLTAGKILTNCPDPKALEGRKTGLALGKVQSGKTSSFIALTALAYDNGYRTVIVLAGTKRNLLGQNTRIVKKKLSLDTRTDRKIAVLSTLDNIEDVRSQDVLGVLENGHNILITLLKHSDHINHLSQVFSLSEINHYPTLIIDDEGDQASLNTRVRKRGKSPTYRSILDLRNTFRTHAYIAFTATPQANLLIRTLDDLSPEFCVLIEPGKGYTGGSTFHGDDQRRYIRHIPDSEVPFQGDDGVPTSFVTALASFLIGACIRSLRGDLRHHSMLVHTSHKKSEHSIISQRVTSLIELWKQKLSLSEQDPGRNRLMEDIEDCFEHEFSQLTGSYPTWKEISSQLQKEIKDLRPWVVNSSEEGEIPTTENMYFKNNIFIGGNMLDRGVTLDGLAVTYITRHAKTPQADTVEQRARWFGYKRSYLDVCRVYAPTPVSQGFTNLLCHEDDIWKSLKNIDEKGVPVKYWPRIFQLAEPFRPTRASVGNASKFDYDGWNIQLRPTIESEQAAHNARVGGEFFDAVEARQESYGSVTHLVAYDCNPIYVANELLLKLSADTTTTDWNNIAFADLLRRLSESVGLTTMDVMWMSSGELRRREVREDGAIKNLMQGRSVRKGSSHPDFYPGDREIHGGKVQLQVHFVQLHKSTTIVSTKTVACALYVPDKLGEELGRLMMGHEYVKGNRNT